MGDSPFAVSEGGGFASSAALFVPADVRSSAGTGLQIGAPPPVHFSTFASPFSTIARSALGTCFFFLSARPCCNPADSPNGPQRVRRLGLRQTTQRVANPVSAGTRRRAREQKK